MRGVLAGLAEDDDDVPNLDDEQEARLAAVFCAIGTMYATVPLTGRTDAERRKSLDTCFTTQKGGGAAAMER